MIHSLVSLTDCTIVSKGNSISNKKRANTSGQWGPRSVPLNGVYTTLRMLRVLLGDNAPHSLRPLALLGMLRGDDIVNDEVEIQPGFKDVIPPMAYH